VLLENDRKAVLLITLNEKCAALIEYALAITMNLDDKLVGKIEEEIGLVVTIVLNNAADEASEKAAGLNNDSARMKFGIRPIELEEDFL
jgi:hypothetical protein